MIKNKGQDIKIIFKIYLRTLKINYKYFRFQTNFCFIKYHKKVFKICSQKFFFTIIF